MDSLLSGALVFTDPMSQLPVFLEDRANIVIYHSAAELRRLLQFYLLSKNEAERIEIGRKGREIALRHHSPAAWVERMVFGNWSTLMG
jgi:spore maturation protein CgeB